MKPHPLTVLSAVVFVMFLVASSLAASPPRSSAPELVNRASPLPERSETVEINGSTTDATSFFGVAAAMDGDTVVIGAPEEGPVFQMGAVYLFERDLGGPNNWGEVIRLTAFDGEEEDEFGFSVALSGDTLVVGTNKEGGGAPPGAAYVYGRDVGGMGSWGLVKRLEAPLPAQDDDLFGSAVSIDGDVIVVGSFERNTAGVDNGSVFVFERNEGGADNWGQVAELQPDDGASNDQFGFAVSISGDTIAVSAPEHDPVGNNDGSVYIFERNQDGPDMWGQLIRLNALDPASDILFGYAVSLEADTLVVGHPLEDTMALRDGAVYVFERELGGPNAWGLLAILTAPDGTTGDHLGLRVHIADDILLAASVSDFVYGEDSGSAYLFQRNDAGTWTGVAKLFPSSGAASDFFGSSLTADGQTVIIGAAQAEGNDPDSGEAYVFELDIAFTDGFESGDFAAWQMVFPAP
ncbi:MAG: hypothetical protein AAGD38_19200 [Acidobacteriota bacterium]